MSKKEEEPGALQASSGRRQLIERIYRLGPPGSSSSASKISSVNTNSTSTNLNRALKRSPASIPTRSQ